MLNQEQIEYILDFIKPQQGIPEKTALSVMEKQKKGLREQLKAIEIHPDDIPELKSQIRTYYFTTLITPGESVGMIAAQSFGEANTQNTLNSIDWNDKILYSFHGKTIIQPIGEMIDELLTFNSEKIVKIPENRTEYFELEEGYTIPSCDENGLMGWYKIEAITRHLPVGDLVKVRTMSGREVTATQSKSFLVWNGEVFEDREGSDIRVGDILPTTISLPMPPVTVCSYFDMETIFPKDEYLYTTEVVKARQLRPKKKEQTLQEWWNNNNGKSFTLPFSGPRPLFNGSNVKKRKFYMECDAGQILINKTPRDTSHIPDKIPLDADFGFIIGIWLAEGFSNKSELGFSNNDNIIEQRIIQYFSKYNVRYSIHNETRTTGIKGVSRNIRFNSTLFVQMFRTLCGTHSTNKKVPTFVYSAPYNFIKGLLDGYYSGDGSVRKSDGNIEVTSVSKDLLWGITVLLSYFGIFSRMSSYQSKKSNTGALNINRTYKLYISNKFAQQFANIISLTESKKQERLHFITLNKDYKYPRGTSQKEFPQDRDVYFDEVISVEYVQGSTEYVYDLTVAETRNFTLWNGLSVRDTFHKAGDTDKTVVSGVARFEELLSVAKSPKGKCCSVYFTENNTSVPELRKMIGNSITELTIDRVALGINEVMNKEDEDWYDMFKLLYNDEFSKHSHCITIKMNMDMLHEYSMSLEDISSVISEQYEDLYCVFSPDSIGQLDIFADMSNIEVDEEVVYVTEDNKELVYLQETVKPSIKSMHICGIPGIKQFYYLRDKSKPGEWMIETDGSNFPVIMSHPDVDKTRTVSNDPLDMVQILGIESANRTIYNEFLNLMPKINKCHAKLLCDKMTYTGSITSISRYAMRKNESGPMGKASFEETLENFLNAAVNGEIETTKGVSASIICGKRANMGTGLPSLHADIQMLQKHQSNSKEEVEVADMEINKSVADMEINKSVADMEINKSVADITTRKSRRATRIAVTK